MILASVRLAIPSKKRREVMEFLNSLAEKTRVESGCLHCRVYRDTKSRDIIMIEDLWSIEDDLNRHLRSDEYRKLLMIMETALEVPEIRFHTISGSTGIETVEKAMSAEMKI